MKEYICSHCGGHVSPHNMRCEYCGTQYQFRDDQIIRIETFQNPVETFTCVEEMPMEMIHQLGAEKAGEMAIRHLSQKFAECIAPMMRIETEQNFQTCAQRIRATVKIIRPVQIDRRW